MRKMVIISSILLSACTSAQPHPHAASKKPVCTPLKAGSRVLITNTGNNSIIINRYMPHNPGLSAGWASKIDPKHVSILATPQQGFCATCTLLKPNSTIDCRSSLRFKTIGKTKSDYWVSENQAP